MKKFLIIVFSILLIVSMAACGNNTTSQKDVSSNSNITEEKVQNSKEIEKENESDKTENTESNFEISEWKQFLKDYEAWVDDYVEILKKYSNNPTDMSILSDYTEMVAELAEWQTKTDKMQQELENASSSELAEYSAELLRIAEKIAEAAY